LVIVRNNDGRCIAQFLRAFHNALSCHDSEQQREAKAMASIFGTADIHTQTNNDASRVSPHGGTAQICVDALHGRFGISVSIVSITILAALVVVAVVIFSIVEAIVPFTRQTAKEILKSSMLYLKLSAICAVGLALLIQ
jgi:hypothetical protein